MRLAVRPFAIIMIAVTVAAAPLAPDGAVAQEGGPAAPSYQPPVDGVVIEPFSLPSGPYGAGNRGIDYATVPGQPVRAAAAGRVSFAGPVAGAMHVTVEHPDGLRTTYAFLASVSVRAETAVDAGTEVGTAGTSLHFSVRRGDQYVDPATVLPAPAGRVHLVPDEPVGAGAGGAQTSRPLAPGELAWVAGPPADGRDASCTNPEVAPPRSAGRRIAVLVGGLGSTSTAAAVSDADTAALGYAAGDVVRFSYRGGRIPSPVPVSADLAGIAVNPYGAADTVGDVRTAATGLGALLAAVAASAPGATVDVIAHSLGGVVTRAALAELEAAGDRSTLDALGVVVTLGSPHRGADLVTAARLVRATGAGAELLAAAGAAAGLPMRAGDVAIAQLAPGSPLLDELATAPLPSGLRVVSVGARGDLVVPANRTRLDGARNVVVSVAGATGDHDALPGSSAAAREVALAIGGLPPSCERRLDRFADAVTGPVVGFIERMAGAAAAIMAIGLSPTRAPG